MKKRFGLVLIEAPLFGSIFLRVIFAFIAFSYIGNLIEALQAEAVTRGGKLYTLEDNLGSYLTRVLMYAAFSFIGCWYATFGTTVINDK